MEARTGESGMGGGERSEERIVDRRSIEQAAAKRAALLGRSQASAALGEMSALHGSPPDELLDAGYERDAERTLDSQEEDEDEEDEESADQGYAQFKRRGRHWHIRRLATSGRLAARVVIHGHLIVAAEADARRGGRQRRAQPTGRTAPTGPVPLRQTQRFRAALAVVAVAEPEPRPQNAGAQIGRGRLRGRRVHHLADAAIPPHQNGRSASAAHVDAAAGVAVESTAISHGVLRGVVSGGGRGVRFGGGHATAVVSSGPRRQTLYGGDTRLLARCVSRSATRSRPGVRGCELFILAARSDAAARMRSVAPPPLRCAAVRRQRARTERRSRARQCVRRARKVRRAGCGGLRPPTASRRPRRAAGHLGGRVVVYSGGCRSAGASRPLCGPVGRAAAPSPDRLRHCGESAGHARRALPLPPGAAVAQLSAARHLPSGAAGHLLVRQPDPPLPPHLGRHGAAGQRLQLAQCPDGHRRGVSDGIPPTAQRRRGRGGRHRLPAVGAARYW
eukprot:ctg_1555.g547